MFLPFTGVDRRVRQLRVSDVRFNDRSVAVVLNTWMWRTRLGTGKIDADDVALFSQYHTNLGTVLKKTETASHFHVVFRLQL